MKYVAAFGFVVLCVLSLRAQEIASRPSLSEGERAGERLFLQRCSVCHLGMAPRHETNAPPLDRQLIEDSGEESVREDIMKGAPGMPGWQYALEPSEVDRIIGYLKTVEKR